MSSATPPNPFFSGINFNPSFFTVISGYLTEVIANTKYLRLIGGTLSGFLGIKRTPRVELDVNGKAVINDASIGVPANGVFGSTGTKLILTEGTVSETPNAIGTDSTSMWYGTSSTKEHRFFTGTNQRMVVTSSGSVGIGTTVGTSINTKLTIIGSSTGYSQPLVQITQSNPVWDGNYALQVDGYTILGGFRINANDGGNSIYQTLANKDIGIAQFPDNANTGNISTTTFGSGTIRFFTNGNNERMRINSSGNIGIGTNDPKSLLHMHSSANSADVALRITDNTTGTAANRGISIQKTNLQDMFLFVYENARMYFFTNNLVRMNILANGNVGIGALSPDTVSSCFQVGDGGKMRISNDSTDSTLIGSKNGVDANNTRLIVYGYQHASRAGCMEYVATTATGAHTFWLNNSTSVADIDSTDFTVYNSITTIGANYYTDGEYASYTTKTNTGGVVKSGYFITNEYFFNSMVMVAFSHNDTTYTWWHGYYGTNNATAVMYVTALQGFNMIVESFQEQTTNKSWIYIRPSIAYNTAVQLRIKFYG